MRPLAVYGIPKRLDELVDRAKRYCILAVRAEVPGASGGKNYLTQQLCPSMVSAARVEGQVSEVIRNLMAFSTPEKKEHVLQWVPELLGCAFDTAANMLLESPPLTIAEVAASEVAASKKRKKGRRKKKYRRSVEVSVVGGGDVLKRVEVKG